jgi:hypothetical protein
VEEVEGAKMNKRQLKKARKKAGYWIYARNGATQWMCRKRSCAKLTSYERQVLAKEIKDCEKIRDDAMRQAILEVTGEDMNEW